MPSRIRLLPLLALFATSAALADGDHDHERARAALREGRILPLEEILARAGAAYPGKVLDVEFEDEHGRFLYEIKTITADGRILELEYDAATGELLKAEGHGRKRR